MTKRELLRRAEAPGKYCVSLYVDRQYAGGLIPLPMRKSYCVEALEGAEGSLTYTYTTDDRFAANGAFLGESVRLGAKWRRP